MRLSKSNINTLLEGGWEVSMLTYVTSTVSITSPKIKGEYVILSGRVQVSQNEDLIEVDWLQLAFHSNTGSRKKIITLDAKEHTFRKILDLIEEFSTKLWLLLNIQTRHIPALKTLMWFGNYLGYDTFDSVLVENRDKLEKALSDIGH